MRKEVCEAIKRKQGLLVKQENSEYSYNGKAKTEQSHICD